MVEPSGHGNMVARSGDGWSVSGQRSYDAWGVASSASGLDAQYVANLGHKFDAKSGLTYMRARYYEPWTGRSSAKTRRWTGGTGTSTVGTMP